MTRPSAKTSLFSTHLQLHVIVFIWSFTAILGKIILIPAIEMVFYRTLLSALGLLILLKVTRKPLVMNKRDFWITMSAGAILAIHWVSFFLAARIANVSICLAGMATAPLWTSLIDPLVNKRKVRLYEPLVAIVSAIGILIVLQSTTAADTWGLLVGIASAVLSALFTIINGQLVNRQNHYTITFYEMVGACTMVVLFFPLYHYTLSTGGIDLSVSGIDWMYLIVLSIGCTVYPYVIAVKLMKKLSPFTVNLAINLEPVYGITTAVVLFGSQEQMGVNFYWGALLIVASVLLYPLLRKLSN